MKVEIYLRVSEDVIIGHINASSLNLNIIEPPSESSLRTNPTNADFNWVLLLWDVSEMQ